MILQSLYELAESERLVPDPDFEMKPVAWTIVLKPDGELVQIKSRRTNLNEGTKRKPKWVGNPMLVPRQPYRSGTKAEAYFLCDNAKFVFAQQIGTENPPDQSSNASHQRFRLLIERCHSETSVPELGSVLLFLDSLPTETNYDALPDDVQSNDLFAFAIGLGECVHLLPQVVQWWNEQHSGNSSGSDFLCLVTGERFRQIEQFPQVANVPGAPKPIKLVSFNRSAFTSYHLDRNENAPISAKSGIFVAGALNRLLHPACPDPANPDRTLPKRNIRLTADTAACFWAASRDDEVNGLLDSIPDLFDAEHEDSVAEMYRSVWRGKPVPLQSPADFYVLVLSGAQGRAVVRDWIETTLGTANENLAQHFADLRIVRNTLAKKGATLEPVIPLRRLAESIAAEGKSENIPASVEAGFLRAAFTGTPYPFQLLQRALVRTRAEAGSRSNDQKKVIERSQRRDSRAALIRAVLNRRRRFDPHAFQRYPEVTESMNPNLESPGYSLGLLMAVLERLQQLALGDVNATIVDRYFGAASATPRTVFVRLLKNSRHHAEKATDTDEGKNRFMAQRLDRIIDFICSRFTLNRKQYPPQSDGIPAHLDLEQQGLFVLGYHQMRHWLWMSREERDAWEANQNDLPRVFSFRKEEQTETATA
ncbi:MAG: type I-C CRISPR-associated protein Cas8c/Csd1 [Planctomycetaceae bacterium]